VSANLPPRLAGLAGAAGLVAAVAGLMLLAGAWNGELLAPAMLFAVPVYVVARDGTTERAPRPQWVPPRERSLRAGRR